MQRIWAIALAVGLSSLLSVVAWLVTPIVFVHPSLQIRGAIAMAQSTITPSQALDRLFTRPDLQADWFASSFLQQVPLPQIQAILRSITTDLGAYRQIEPTAEANRFMVLFEQGSLQAQISLNASGQIATLLLQPNALTLEEAIAQLQALPGTTSLLVLKDGVKQAAINADEPLAVGSAFKLAVLRALQQQIEQGDRTWAETVQLDPTWKSLPSGILQSWPEGASLTLETLATLMISLSDNTATDALIQILGREAVEAYGLRNVPFLTTRELFVLKAPENAQQLQQYRDGDGDTRRSLLSQLQTLPLPPVETFLGEPIALDVEWFFSTRELCSLIESVAALPLMGVNPGIANPADWNRIAYKGGSESGVINLTSHLQAADGTTYCIAATWNNPDAPLSDMTLIGLYQGLISGLKTAPAANP
ncbi:serine hydrolase [Leptolyngbya sp. AN02str]|uniref:serine hydrolase n=1 Tax=Leptolyngbya sp. AN02str TaxID=3423363 RepID=UPI003D31F4F6